jgi:hypothetical protein
MVVRAVEMLLAQVAPEVLALATLAIIMAVVVAARLVHSMAWVEGAQAAQPLQDVA